MAITPISATEVAQIERRLAMAEGRIGFLARLVAQAAQKQVVAPVPWDPHWLLSCFPRLGMRRGRQLAGYLVACPGHVRAIHVLSRGEAPYNTRWLERQITHLEWAPWAGGCPTEWPTPLTPFLDTGLCLDDSPAGWWQLWCQQHPDFLDKPGQLRSSRPSPVRPAPVPPGLEQVIGKGPALGATRVGTSPLWASYSPTTLRACSSACGHGAPSSGCPS